MVAGVGLSLGAFIALLFIIVYFISIEAFQNSRIHYLPLHNTVGLKMAKKIAPTPGESMDEYRKVVHLLLRININCYIECILALVDHFEHNSC
jgi:hypothetical protein